MKKWYLSKTLWFNGIIGLITGVTTTVNSEWATEFPDGAKALVFIVAIGNALIRFKTKEPITK